jgi:ATP-dependent DNA helicase RecQ
MLFGPADMVTQRKLGERGRAGNPRLETALAAIERYAHASSCRQQLLCAHFTGTEEHEACGQCDACIDPASVVAPAPREVIAPLAASEQQVILEALAHVDRAIGKGNLVKALRGSQAKGVVAAGLMHLPQHGALAVHSEDAIAATIELLLRDRKLVRRGRKFPMLALPTTHGTPRTARAARTSKPTRTFHGIKLALETYRKQKARQLKWKSYMVFQRSTIVAIDAKRPASMHELAQIPGLGPARLARFGEDILALVRRHTSQ